MKKLRVTVLFADWWRPVLASLAGLLFIATILFYHIGSHVPALSPSEAVVQQQIANKSLSGKAILNDPLFLPHKIGLYTLEKAGKVGPTAIRSLSAIFGLVAMSAFFSILKRWHTTRIAIMGTILFATSAWFLHTARLADQSASFLLILPFVAACLYLDKDRDNSLPTILSLTTGAFLLYIPGLVWLLVAAGVWQRKRLAANIKKLSILPLVAAGLILLIVLGPLLRAFILDVDLLSVWIGLPEAMPNVVTYLRQLALVPWRILVRGPLEASLWVGRAPLLEIFSSAMLVLGMYAYWFKRKLDRTKALGASVVVLAPLIALGGSVAIISLIGFVYVFVAAGLALMLQQWFTVFPRNPFARGLGVTLLTGAIGLACMYNLFHYFRAWPKAPETKQTFQVQPLDLVK